MQRGSGSREAESVREEERRVHEPSPSSRVGGSESRGQSQAPQISFLGYYYLVGL